MKFPVENLIAMPSPNTAVTAMMTPWLMFVFRLILSRHVPRLLTTLQNPNFFFSPYSLILYAAAAFLYELFPSFGNKGTPDLETMKTFFGAVEDASAPGGWRHVPERIPDNWFSRVEPYTIADTAAEILTMYLQYPKLFGGNVGTNNFDALNTTYDIIRDGKLPDDATVADLTCLLYQLAVSPVPSMLGTVSEITGAVLDFATSKLNPVFNNSGCALKVG